MSLGARIRRARQASGLKGTELARAADVRAHTLWRYEAAKIRPSADALLRIAHACGVTMEWLLTGDGEGPAELEATGTEG